MNRTVYFVPFSEEGLGDRLFLPYKNPTANVPPFGHLRDYLTERGVEAKTIDFWNGKKESADTIISFDYPPTGMYRLAYFLRGMLGKKGGFALSPGKLEKMLKTFRKKILFQWESPVNNPWMYNTPGGFHELYDKVYSIPDFPGTERFYYPQNFDSWNREHFDRPRSRFVVFMNSPRRAKGFFRKELYAKREEAAEFFARHEEIDVYGAGWERHKNMAIRGAAKGASENKPETISRYKFALCFENAIWPGYVTEKIFDCMYVGTIPIYWGAPNIEKYVPPECFIDMRKFSIDKSDGYDYAKLREFLHSLRPEEIAVHRAAAKSYFNSDNFKKKFTKEAFAETILQAIAR